MGGGRRGEGEEEGKGRRQGMIGGRVLEQGEAEDLEGNKRGGNRWEVVGRGSAYEGEGRREYET